ncbi:trafficking protein particle complex subunit 3 [Guillardia theta CCMP2712]|uniref:Trafficking protein particle complex subunit n=1 Tax=Guillardia theta (strain CCMP2712) TaxID=905079 RepID=L1JCD7_GUITC|nr:trafficking protein particle complex subunit 3 [Guillardia theta CCMP2712]EKX45972.1 trafficking protein particle complex subunit 3 [Guillardia theta CCMP2712]|eukprot:XP_005832952.1 trafficking protein particle complex subunit 3 [Guillardia theta CCMP2712]
MAAANKNHIRNGEQAFQKMDKINAELFTLTYGSMVQQLLKDYEDPNEVNIQLDKMGFGIGQRLIDELLAKSNVGQCSDFRETAEVLAKVGFKMFLGVTGNISNWNQEDTEFSLLLDDNPLVDFVEIPDDLKELKYCNILCGVIRGALEMVNLRVECEYTKCTLWGDDCMEIRVRLLEKLEDKYPFDDDD